LENMGQGKSWIANVLEKYSYEIQEFVIYENEVVPKFAKKNISDIILIQVYFLYEEQKVAISITILNPVVRVFDIRFDKIREKYNFHLFPLSELELKLNELNSDLKDILKEISIAKL